MCWHFQSCMLWNLICLNTEGFLVPRMQKKLRVLPIYVNVFNTLTIFLSYIQLLARVNLILPWVRGHAFLSHYLVKPHRFPGKSRESPCSLSCALNTGYTLPVDHRHQFSDRHQYASSHFEVVYSLSLIHI